MRSKTVFALLVRLSANIPLSSLHGGKVKDSATRLAPGVDVGTAVEEKLEDTESSRPAVRV